MYIHNNLHVYIQYSKNMFYLVLVPTQLKDVLYISRMYTLGCLIHL